MSMGEKSIAFRRLVTKKLMHEDTKLALTVFLMHVDPPTYEPKIGTSLSSGVRLKQNTNSIIKTLSRRLNRDCIITMMQNRNQVIHVINP